MFCPQCDAVFILKKSKGKKNAKQSQIIICRDCGVEFQKEKEIEEFLIRSKIEHGIESLIEVIEFNEDQEKISPETREELRERYREAPIYLS